MLTRGKYLLDTDICIAMVKDHANVRQHIRQHDHLDLKISEITIAEMLFGLALMHEANSLHKVMWIFSLCPTSRSILASSH